MASVLTVTFEDGSTKSIRLRPIHLVMAERARPAMQQSPIESTYYAGWIADGKPGRFDDWLDTLADGREVEEETVPPLPDQSPGESPT
jgi:hypothetical protein